MNCFYLLAAFSCLSLVSCKSSFVETELNTDKNILSFGINPEIDSEVHAENYYAEIDDQAGSLNLTFFSNSDISSLHPVFELSEKAELWAKGVKQESGLSLQDFSTPLTYTVVAENGTTRNYSVNVQLIPEFSGECDLNYIELGGRKFYPSGGKLFLRSASDLTNVDVSCSISDNASIYPPLGKGVDFTSIDRLTVTAEDGIASKEYAVVLMSPLSEIKGGDIKILGWCGIPEDYNSPETFRQMKEAGFDINLTQYYYSQEGADKALEYAAEVGMEVILMTYDVTADLENTVSHFKDRDGFLGYYVADEPGAARFAELGETVRKIKEVDPNALCYANMFPDAATSEQLSGESGVEITYDEYILRFDSEINSQIVSFDYYPIVYRDGVFQLQSSWYNNLEKVSKLAESTGKPFWTFALSTPHWDFKEPTIENLRLQIYSDLAYGSQCIQYFTYWTPVYDGSPFYTAPINPDGSVSEIYYTVKEMNTELKKYASVFSGAKRKLTRHYGRYSIPLGTVGLSESDYPPVLKNLEFKGNSALFSLLENGQTKILVIQNTSPVEMLEFEISLDSSVNIVMSDGYSYDTLESENVCLTAGDMAVYIWSD